MDGSILSDDELEEDISFEHQDDQDQSEYNNVVEKKNVIKARVLMENDEVGQTLYGFKTPKRKEALARAAQESIQSAKKSGRKSKKSVVSKTPVSKRISKQKMDEDEEKLSNEQKRKPLSRIQGMNCQSNEADDSSDEMNSADDEYDDEQENTDKGKNADLLDEYFEIHHNKRKLITSDKTLSKLSNPKMDQEELRTHLKDIQSTHIQETLDIRTENTKHFDKWMFQMLCGFNIIIYGVGSKYNLLEIFRKNYLKDKIHLVINGFFPSLTIKTILNTITEDLLESDMTFKNIMDHCSYIKKKFNNEDRSKLFLILHNIDGHMLRSKNSQSALGQLASSLNIHVIASIDHINAPLIWDENCSSSFSWLWYDTTTFEPYNEETSYENSLLVQQSGTLALSSLKHVMRSLTPNAKGIFRLLVDYHLDNETNSSYNGMSFSDLYSRCRERFLVNSDSNLRAQLTEFKDHKLIKVKKGFDGVEYLTVMLDNGTLKQFIDES